MKNRIIKKLISKNGYLLTVITFYLLICSCIIYFGIGYNDYYKEHAWFRLIFCISLMTSIIPSMILGTKLRWKLIDYADRIGIKWYQCI